MSASEIVGIGILIPVILAAGLALFDVDNWPEGLFFGFIAGVAVDVAALGILLTLGFLA